MLGAGALGRPRGMVWGGRREEGSGWGTHVNLWRIHFDIWQNQYHIVKLKKKCLCIVVAVQQLLSRVWPHVCQAPLSFTLSQSLFRFTSTELVMLSNRLIPSRTFLLLPWVFPGIRVFPNKSALHIRWPKYWSFSSVQSLSHVWLFVTPWTAPCQASLSITNSWSLLKLMSIESVMPSNHLILCRPLLPPSIFPSIKVFSNE